MQCMLIMLRRRNYLAQKKKKEEAEAQETDETIKAIRYVYNIIVCYILQKTAQYDNLSA